MPIDLERLQNENSKSMTALNNSITRLTDLSDDGLPLSDKAEVNAELLRAKSDKAHLQKVGAHLLAAGTVMQPISPSVETRLNELSERLDDAIRDDFVLNATLDVVRVALGAAREISNITMDHT